MMLDFASLPFWVQYLTRGLLITLLIVSSAVAVSRAGRTPYWALLMIVPYGAVIALWLFAFASWPKEAEKTAAQPATPPEKI